MATDKSSLNSVFDKPSPLSVFQQVFVTNVNILFKYSGSKKKSTSRLSIKDPEPCSTVSFVKGNDSFTAYLLLVKEFKIVLEISLKYR